MKKFYRDFKLCSTSHSFLPSDFQSDFGELITAQIEPTLKGSLQVTIHGRNIDLVDPRTVQDWRWQECSMGPSLTFVLYFAHQY